MKPQGFIEVSILQFDTDEGGWQPTDRLVDIQVSNITNVEEFKDKGMTFIGMIRDSVYTSLTKAEVRRLISKEQHWMWW